MGLRSRWRGRKPQSGYYRLIWSIRLFCNRADCLACRFSLGVISNMSLTQTGYEHIVIGEDNIPVISGTTMKVIELVAERTAYGWSPEELHFQHPYLTLGQIYSALAYYWDHAAELDNDLERRSSHVEHVRQATGPSTLAARLKSTG